MDRKYYLLVIDERRGPFDRYELLDEGMRPNSRVWREGDAEPVPAYRVPELRELFEDAPPLAAPGWARRAPDVMPYTPAQIDFVQRLGASLYRPGTLLILLAIGLGLAQFIVAPLAQGRRFDSEMGQIHESRDSTAEGVQIGLAIAAIVCVVLGTLLQTAGGVVYLFLLYRAWRVVQDGQARTTPGKAVGFLFIPYFNLYWIFVALFGLPKNLNAFIHRHRVPAPYASPVLGLTVCLLQIFTSIPVVGLAALLVLMGVLPAFYKSIARSAAGIAGAWEQRGTATPADLPVSATVGSIWATLAAPLGVVVLLVGLILTGGGFFEMRRAEIRLVVQHEALSHFRNLRAAPNHPWNAGQWDWEIQHLEDDSRRETERRNNFWTLMLVGLGVTGLGVLTLAFAAGLATRSGSKRQALTSSPIPTE
jgi:hypothetical protein